MTKDLLTWWFGISQLTQIHIKNIRTTGTCMRQNLFSAIDNLMICRIEPKEWKENKKFNQIWIDLFRIGLLNALFQDNINILNSCHVLRVFLFKLYNKICNYEKANKLFKHCLYFNCFAYIEFILQLVFR